jgi:hypothetical protein
MAIQQIGSNPTTLDSSHQLKAEILQPRKAYDAANSSLVSLSNAQEEGIGDFFSSLASGVWSIVTWPFRTLGSIWNWMTGAKDEAADKAEGKDKKSSGGGGGKVSEASSDFIAVFKKDEEFDSDKFKSAYSGISADEKKAYRKMLWIAGGYQPAEGSKDWATKLLSKKGEFVESEEEFLRQAADMYKSAPKLRSLGDRMARLADDMLADLDNEESEAEFEKDKKKLDGEFRKLPGVVRDAVMALTEAYRPVAMILSQKQADTAEARQEAAEYRAQAHAMQILAKNNYLAVGDDGARAELETMLRRVGQKGVPFGAERLAGFDREEDDIDESALSERRQKHGADEHPSATRLASSRLEEQVDSRRVDSRERPSVARAHESVQMPSGPVGGITEGEFVREYQHLGATAKKALAESVGYMIGRPEDGEKYIMGKLVVDTKKQVPNVGLLCMALARLVQHDGGEVPSSVQPLLGIRQEDDETVESGQHRDEEDFSAHQPQRKGGLHRVDEEDRDSVRSDKRRPPQRDMSHMSAYPFSYEHGQQLPRGPVHTRGGTSAQQYAQHVGSTFSVDPSLMSGGRGRGQFMPPSSVPFSFDPHSAPMFGHQDLGGLGRGRGQPDLTASHMRETLLRDEDDPSAQRRDVRSDVPPSSLHVDPSAQRRDVRSDVPPSSLHVDPSAQRRDVRSDVPPSSLHVDPSAQRDPTAAMRDALLQDDEEEDGGSK